MLILRRNEIERLVDFDAAVPEIENAYRAYSSAAINQPPVGHIAFPENGGDCHIKYGHFHGDDIFVIKIATGFPMNAIQSVPAGNGLFLVISAKTGDVKAVLHDEMVLTDIRTAIGGAIASRLLARKESKQLLVVGTGTQARLQIDTHLRFFGGALSIALWGRSGDNANQLAAEKADVADIKVSDDLQSDCHLADIIVTTTGAVDPLIFNEWIKPGTHITAVGADAPGKQELDPTLVAEANLLVADSIQQCTDHGEFEVAIKQGKIDQNAMCEIGAILAGTAKGRTDDQQISIADLTGIAAQDIAIAKHVLNRR